ncbi:cellulose binding domain-containing protein [Vibrio quintilis]|uniref:cellulase n=1 Tax=Vibrio quintilis TaxID=1117707 RepID=A0A1M7YTI7_9VIBR|nr:cellulose binding domain-containing protein [Vibrio quintilis]SHO55909.1 Endoglucanase B precursor [Vibrio quintilis]
MKKKLKRLVGCVGLASLPVIAGSAYALTSGAGEATLSLQNSWGSGYCANVSVTNNGDANITSWVVELDLKDATVNNLWNGTLDGSTVTPSGNGTISPDSSVSFGFCASASGSVVTPEIVSLSVEGGGDTGGTSGGDNGGTTGGDNGGTTGGDNGGTTGGDNGGTTGSTEYEPIETGCSGYATRFWDCCKPHCGWKENVPTGLNALQSCSVSNSPLTDFSTQSACSGGSAYTCFSMIPFKVNDDLSYGYAATSSGDVCGRCYQLQFTGESHNSSGDPGSAALKGKTMIVQAVNIGYDVSGGQFDLLVPGGGVGAFNACSAQWGISSSELGSQYGGLLAACKQEIGWNASLDEYKSCLVKRCNSVFGSRNLTEMQQGCLWYANWFEAADNPALKYKEVACPSELSSNSGMDRGSLDDVSTACGN